MSRFHKILVFFLFLVPVYITWSAASVISVSVLIILFLFSEYHLQFNFLKMKYFLLVIIMAFLGIVVFRIQNYFSRLIVDVLGKSLTLSGRIYFWDRTLASFVQHPLLGIGVNTRVDNFAILGAPHPHNFFLRVLYETGILGMICLAIILLLVVHALKNAKNKYCYILSVILFCFFIVFLAESFDDMKSFFGIITIAYHIDQLTDGLDEPEERKRWRIVFRRRPIYITKGFLG